MTTGGGKRGENQEREDDHEVVRAGVVTSLTGGDAMIRQTPNG
jgi:hypothetical protein